MGIISKAYNNFIHDSIYSRNFILKLCLFRKLSFLLLDFKARRIKLHITNKCNLACKTCYYKAEGEEMDSSHIFSLFDQLKNHEWKLDILGGEPLLRNDFFEIILYAKKIAKFKTIQVFTNATLVDNSVAQKMKDSGVDIAIIPLYSHIPDIHDGITQFPGSWQKTIRGASALVKAGVRTYSFILFMSCNSGTIKELELLARSLGTKPIFFPYIKQHICDNFHIANKSKYQVLVNYSFNNSAKHRREVLQSIECRGKVCYAFVNTVSIKSDGTVTPCPFVDLKLGNIKQDKFYSILHAAYDNTELLNYLSIPEECSGCTCVDICGGGCKAYNFQLYKDTKHKDINCSGPYRENISRGRMGEFFPYFF